MVRPWHSYMRWKVGVVQWIPPLENEKHLPDFSLLITLHGYIISFAFVRLVLWIIWILRHGVFETRNRM